MSRPRCHGASVAALAMQERVVLCMFIGWQGLEIALQLRDYDSMSVTHCRYIGYILGVAG